MENNTGGRHRGLRLRLVCDPARRALLSELLAVAVALAQGESVLRLGVAGAYALIGSACGTSSKAAIEGAFSFFGARRCRLHRPRTQP
jgi:hypothetical protein